MAPVALAADSGAKRNLCILLLGCNFGGPPERGHSQGKYRNRLVALIVLKRRRRKKQRTSWRDMDVLRACMMKLTFVARLLDQHHRTDVNKLIHSASSLLVLGWVSQNWQVN